MRDIKFNFYIFCTDELSILNVMLFIYSLHYKVIYLYLFGFYPQVSGTRISSED